MKRALSIILAAMMMTTVLAGCNNSTENTSGSGESKTSASEDTSWQKVEESGEFILGLDDSFPPMGYRDSETGEIVGFDIDLAQEVCDRLGVKLTTQPINWDTKEMELDNGNIDCIWNGFTYTDERNEQMNLTEAYMKNTQVILVTGGSEYQSRDDLAGKTVAVQTGSSGENAVNDSEDFKNSLANVISTDTYLNAIMELDNGTVDAVVLDEKVAETYTKDNDKYRLIQKDGANDYLTEEEYVIGFRKSDDALKNKVVDTLKEMAADGTMAEISEKWFGEDVTTIK
ncbi:MAG: amino acid ABC transporter substrate-binding protein [Acutalibacteraceae bacterium]|nr:amino acid ABC transporter substrate-binding protein [Acutalibacteraceae bacterium]